METIFAAAGAAVAVLVSVFAIKGQVLKWSMVLAMQFRGWSLKELAGQVDRPRQRPT